MASPAMSQGFYPDTISTDHHRSSLLSCNANMPECMTKMLALGMSLEESIEAPRIHVEGKNLYFEPGIDISSDIFLRDISLHSFDEKNLFFGGVNAVSITDGFSDLRRGGTFEIV